MTYRPDIDLCQVYGYVGGDNDSVDVCNVMQGRRRPSSPPRGTPAYACPELLVDEIVGNYILNDPSRRSTNRSFAEQEAHDEAELDYFRRASMMEEMEEQEKERRALCEIAKYRTCYPNASENEILQKLICACASPDVITFQAKVVAAEAQARQQNTSIAEVLDKERSKRSRIPQPDSSIFRCRTTKRFGKIPPVGTRIPVRRPMRRPMPGPPCPLPAIPLRMAPEPPQQVTTRRQPCPRQRPCPFPQPPPCPQTPTRSSAEEGRTPRPPIFVVQQQVGGSTSPGGRSSVRSTPSTTSRPPGTPQPQRRVSRIPRGVPGQLESMPRPAPRGLAGTRIPVRVFVGRPDGYPSLQKTQSLLPEDSQFGQTLPENIDFEETNIFPSEEAPCVPNVSFGRSDISSFGSTLARSTPDEFWEDEQVPPGLAAEVDPEPPPSFNFSRIQSMVDSENRELKEMNQIIKKLTVPATSRFKDMYTITAHIFLNETEGETPPEVAASMLYSDEKGVGLKSPPAKVYNTLFQGGEKPDKTTVTVNSATEESNRVMVPVGAEGVRSALVAYEEAAMFDMMPAPVIPEDLPAASGGSFEEEEGETSKTLGITESDYSQQISASNLGEASESPFKVTVQMDKPSFHNCAQMRGSQPPHWFPGYYVATGECTGISLIEKPWGVLERAWQVLRPGALRTKEGGYIIGI